MSILEFFADWLGTAEYPYIVIAFACASGLIIFDNIVRFLLNIISSLFKKNGSGRS